MIAVPKTLGWLLSTAVYFCVGARNFIIRLKYQDLYSRFRRRFGRRSLLNGRQKLQESGEI